MYWFSYHLSNKSRQFYFFIIAWSMCVLFTLYMRWNKEWGKIFCCFFFYLVLTIGQDFRGGSWDLDMGGFKVLFAVVGISQILEVDKEIKKLKLIKISPFLSKARYQIWNKSVKWLPRKLKLNGMMGGQGDTTHWLNFWYNIKYLQHFGILHIEGSVST